MSYYLSPALVTLRAQINQLWPGRDRGSDGWIGDAAHGARKSDHNPDYSAGGIVRAIDVDKDGIPTSSVVDQIIRDPRVAYVIWAGRIWENPAAFPGRGYWRAYTGPNGHFQHFHVSVRRGATWDRNGGSWGIGRTISNSGPDVGGPLPDIGTVPIDGITPIPEDDMYSDADRQRDIEIHAMLGAGDATKLRVEDTVGYRVRDIQMALTNALPVLLSASGVDEGALATALAPLLQGSIPALSDVDLQRIAKAAADEQSRRLAG